MTTYGRVKDSKSQADEHVSINGKYAKRTLLSGYDGANLQDVNVDSDGNIFITDAGRGVATHETEAVTDTATILTISGTPQNIIIQNIGTNVVYIGGSGVTSSAYGISIFPSEKWDLGKIKSTMTFYHICASGQTSTLGVLKFA